MFEVCAFGLRALTCQSASWLACLFGGELLLQQLVDVILTLECELKQFHCDLKNKNKEERSKVAALVHTNEVINSCFFIHFCQFKCESLINYFYCLPHFRREAILLQDQQDKVVVEGVEGLNQVDKDNIQFFVVLPLKLNGCLEREDSVGATFLLQATALLLKSFVPDVGIHLFSDNHRQDSVSDVEQTDLSPVVRIGGLSFHLIDGTEGAKFPFFRDRSAFPDRGQHIKDGGDGSCKGGVGVQGVKIEG